MKNTQPLSPLQSPPHPPNIGPLLLGFRGDLAVIYRESQAPHKLMLLVLVRFLLLGVGTVVVAKGAFERAATAFQLCIADETNKVVILLWVIHRGLLPDTDLEEVGAPLAICYQEGTDTPTQEKDVYGFFGTLKNLMECAKRTLPSYSGIQQVEPIGENWVIL